MSIKYRELKNCPWCQKNDLEEVAKRTDGVAILRCKNCQVMFVQKIPFSLKDLYGKDYFEKEFQENTKPIGYFGYQKAIFQNLLWQTTLVSLVATSPGKILDIGCATGEFLETMQRLGWQTFGFEISQWATEICRKKNLKIYQGEFENNQLPSASFNAISAWEFLEHVLDLKKNLKEIKRLLKPGGIFFFSTPNSQPENKENWLGLKTSFEHIFYLDKKSTERMLLEIFGTKPVILELGDKKETLVGFLVLGEKKPPFNKEEEKRWLKNLINSLLKTGISINSLIQIRLEILEENWQKSLEKLKEMEENWQKSLEKLKRLEEKLQKTEKEKTDLQNILNSVYNSKSWKITAPLRLIYKHIQLIIKGRKRHEENPEN